MRLYDREPLASPMLLGILKGMVCLEPELLLTKDRAWNSVVMHLKGHLRALRKSSAAC